MVSRVTIDKNRDLKVEIRMDLLDLGGEDPDQGDSTGVQVSKDGTYTRIFDFYRTLAVVVTL